MWQLGFQIFIAIDHVMDFYKFQWPLLVLMSCRHLLHPSSGWVNGYRGILKWWGGKKGIRVGSFEDVRAVTATEGRRGDSTWSWANRPNQLRKGENKHVLSALSYPLLWPDKLPQTFLYNWQVFSQPTPIHPPGPSHSPSIWWYIPAKHQK